MSDWCCQAWSCGNPYSFRFCTATALHPQTLLVLTWDNQILPPEYGYPMKLHVPTKLGYKNHKNVKVIEITNHFPGGYWEDKGYNWFGGS